MGPVSIPKYKIMLKLIPKLLHSKYLHFYFRFFLPEVDAYVQEVVEEVALPTFKRLERLPVLRRSRRLCPTFRVHFGPFKNHVVSKR